MKSFSATIIGVDATTVSIEVHAAQGQPKTYWSGLPDNAVRESQSRIEAALKVNGFRWPGMRMVINLAPADMRKEIFWLLICQLHWQFSLLRDRCLHRGLLNL